MKIISFIEEAPVIGKILLHCKLWKENSRPPPQIEAAPIVKTESFYDYTFVEPA
jgi:hypothetical protein